MDRFIIYLNSTESKYIDDCFQWFSLKKLQEMIIVNVPFEKYHEYLMTDFAKEHLIQFVGARNMMFIDYVAEPDFYELNDSESDVISFVKLNFTEFPELSKEYSNQNWSVFVELPDHTIKYLFTTKDDSEFDLYESHKVWAEHVCGPIVKLFAIRKKSPFYVFRE